MTPVFRQLHRAAAAWLIGASASTFAADSYLGRWSARLDSPNGGEQWLYEVSLARSRGAIVGTWSVESVADASGSIGCFKGALVKRTIVVDECVVDGSRGSKSGAAACPEYDHRSARLIVGDPKGASLIWQTRPTGESKWRTFATLARVSAGKLPKLETCQ